MKCKKKTISHLGAGILALLIVGALIFTGFAAEPFFASIKAGTEAKLTAKDHWEMLSGWTDYTANGMIAFENNNDQAGTATYKSYIDGAEGFRISFRIDFPDPDKLSTSRIVLSSESRYNYFFDMQIRSQNGQAGLSVGYCNGGPWAAPVVADTGMLGGAGNAVRLTIFREQNSKYIRFSLMDLSGNVLYSAKATDAVYQGQKFLDGNDLRLQVCTVTGGNRFRFSELSLDTYPDDGTEESLSADEFWSIPSGWTDASADGKVAISSAGASGINYYKPGFKVTGDLRISFVVTPGAAEATQLYLSLSCPALSSYLRWDLTWEPSGAGFQATESASLNLGAENNYAWSTLGGTAWNWTGKSYRVTLQWLHNEQRLVLTRESTEADTGTIPTSVELDAPKVGKDVFFDLCDGNDLNIVLSQNNAAAFTISDFSLETGRAADEEWSMPNGWKDLSTVDELSFAFTGAVAEENLWRNTLEGIRGFDISYTVDFATTGASLETLLRSKTFTDQYLRLVHSGDTAQMSVMLGYVKGETETILTESPGLSLTDGKLHVRLQRQAGSSTLTLGLSDSSGQTLWTQSVKNEKVTALNFYEVSPLTVSMKGTAGSCVVTGFGDAGYLRESCNQNLYDLGKGWSSYLDDEGALYLVKADGRENEAVYRPSLRGDRGFRISYDLTFFTDLLTTTYVKLGILDTREIFFFSRIKGEAGTVYAEGQVYTDGVWSGKLLSANAATKHEIGGTVRVTLQRQQASNDLRFIISLPDGTVLIDEVIIHDSMDLNVLNHENVRFIIGRDSNASAFRISNVTVSDYPAEAVAASDLSVNGKTEAQTGDRLLFTAALNPSDATIQSYSWRVDGGLCSADNQLSICFKEPGTHTVSLTVTDCSGNTYTDTVTLTVKPVPAGMGDVNLDGVIDRNDAWAILWHSAGKASLTGEQLAYGDMNADGIVNSADAQRVLKMLEGQT